MLGDGFCRKEVDGVRVYTCDALDSLPGLRHGFSTRHGGRGAAYLNLGLVAWDYPERVEENRRRFLAALGLQNANIATLSQIHSDQVRILDEEAEEWNSSSTGDAMATRRTGIALGILTADCLPVLVADPDTGAIAAAHAGWRGTLARILSKTIAKMCIAFGSEPSRLLVAIGPGIRSCCYEVGPEVAELFKIEFSGTPQLYSRKTDSGGVTLDLRCALEVQFSESGIEPDRVWDLGACTRCNSDEFFSYRSEGPRSGRMMAVIGRP